MGKKNKQVFHEAGKGVKPIPRQISKEEFDKNWDRIFSKKDVDTEQK